MAPTKPAARRGRPPKAETEAKKASTAANGTEIAEAPVKRGRGRPPKNGVSKVVKKTTTGRGRGRPPKDPSQLKTAKPRGRPRKSDAAASTSTTPKATKTAKATKPTKATTTETPGKRGRGRPRKSAATEEVALESDQNEEEDAAEEPVVGDIAEDDEGEA